MKKKEKNRNIAIALLLNILLAYSAQAICRIIFIAANYNLYADSLHNNPLWQLLKGSLLFDTSAVCYLNIPYILLLLLPLHYKEGNTMQALTRTFFVVGNGIGMIANLCDVVYVPFTGRRTTWSVFTEFSNEGNMLQIIGSEIVSHWYLVAIGILLLWLLNRLYSTARNTEKSLAHYYIMRTILLAIVAPLIIFGIRGGIGKAVRPITISNANQYISRPDEAAIVLNTPFSLIRTIGKSPFKEVHYHSDEVLENIFSPLRHYAGDSVANKKNIVIFIMESFGKEYIGAYNPHQERESLTPFLDSLINVSRSYAYSYGNGRKSIDGMPSVLSGIPMFVEPFFVTPASLNRVSGIAGELGKEGYHTAFFHGAPNGSMGFQAFAKTTGFQEYYGMNEFNASADHNGMNDFDGTWAIWDEPFFQFYYETMERLPQPFITAMFSASSHHPFRIPDEYIDRFKEGAVPIHKCVQYTDNALRKFFEKAKTSEWFDNTLFIITADHSNQSIEEEYQTSSGFFEVPIIFYSPTGDAPFDAGIDSTLVAQQTDIMPTILEYTGYSRPFLSFGKSLISCSPQDSYAVNYTNETYQYYKDRYILLFDGNRTTAVYDIRNDHLMQNNLANDSLPFQKQMECELKAIIQQYMQRMLNDRLVPDIE